MYVQDTFYTTTHLSLEKKIELLYDAKERSFEWWVDRLEGFGRKRIENFPFDSIIEKLSDAVHFVFIKRGGYETNGSQLPNKILGCFIIEIGFCTMNSAADLFLFIRLDKDHIDYFTEKYELQPRT